MKLVLVVVLCISFPFVVTDNGKTTSGSVQTEKDVNDIPVDPGGIDDQSSRENTGQQQSDQDSKLTNNGKEESIEPLSKDINNERPEQIKAEPTQATQTSDRDVVKEDKGPIKAEQPDVLKEDVKKEELPKDAPLVEEVGIKLTEIEVKSEKVQTDGKDASTPESGEMKKQEEEIQTFTEWTQKVLEEEKQKTSSETTGSVSKTKRSTNYASKECGAKVLASNPEAENVKHILTSNRDEYMINPCKVSKKWFVIELCEPVHISNFEIATFELFSSQPKTFRVSLSDRYPTKEWTNIGEFTATEERIPQAFNVKQGYVVQFVKVELLDHYGTEHFCPLTWFKIFGVPVEYDEYGHKSDVHDEDNDSDMDEALLKNGDNAEESDTHKNLFESATNTVMKLVKKVLNVEDKQDSKETGKNGTVPSEGQSSNETYAVNKTADGIILPCVPEKKGTEKDRKYQPSPPLPQQTGSITMPESDDKKTKQDESIVTKLEDHEQVPSVSDELVTLIPTDDDDDIVSCDIPTNEKTALFYYQRPMCKYFEVMKHSQRYPSCSVNDSQQEGHEKDDRGNKTKVPNGIKVADGETDEQVKINSIVIEPSVSKEPSVATKHATESKDESTTQTVGSTTQAIVMSTSSASTKTLDQTATADRSIVATSSSKDEPSKLPKEESYIEVKPKTSDIVSEIIQPSSTSKSEEVNTGDTTPSLDSSRELKSADFILVDTTPSQQTQQTSEAKVHPEVPSAIEAPKVEPSTSSSEVVLQTTVLKINVSEGPNTEVVEPVVVGDNVPAVQDTRDLKLIHVPVLPYQKRETAIMRLNNRIKALEMNVSLSSRFLEEMSQKFKKQTEDMIKQHTFNKTISELSNITKAIEVQGQIQKQKIDVLETTVQNLTEIVVRLTERVESLNQQVHDREFRYIVTVVVFCVVAMALMRRRSNKTPPEPEQTKIQPKPIIKRRRNSFSVCDNERIDNLGSSIQRFNSESTLVDPRHFSSDVDPGGISQTHSKKKKKKKQKMNGSSCSLPGDVRTPQQKSDYNSAGLLFGTSSRETTPENPGGKKGLSRSESHGGIFCLFSGDKRDNKLKAPDKRDKVSVSQERKEVSTQHSWSVGSTHKKGNRQGKICQPGRVSEDIPRGRRSGSLNGYNSDGEDNVDHFLPCNGNSTNNDIYIVSPFKKGFSFTKGSMQNGHKDPMLKSSTGKHGRKSHTRTKSTDLTLRTVSFKEMNGHR